MVQLAPGASSNPDGGASSQKLESWVTMRPLPISAPSLMRAGPDMPSLKSDIGATLRLVRISR
jgi:hypothetical protein